MGAVKSPTFDRLAAGRPHLLLCDDERIKQIMFEMDELRHLSKRDECNVQWIITKHMPYVVVFGYFYDRRDGDNGLIMLALNSEDHGEEEIRRLIKGWITHAADPNGQVIAYQIGDVAGTTN